MKIKNLKFVTPAKRSSNPMEQWSHDCRRMTKTRNCSAGFTLIEMVITILVFSILVVTIVGIFIQAVRIERRAVLAQQIQENATYVLESMAKEIRVSEIVDQDSPNCVATEITLNHPINGTIIYGLSSNGLGNIERQDGEVEDDEDNESPKLKQQRRQQQQPTNNNTKQQQQNQQQHQQ